MVHFSSFVALSIAASLASAIPLQRRIAQTIADSTAPWAQACNAAGGASQCNSISQQAFTSLLAAGGNCDQQDAADAMVDLAKQLNNDADMIRLAQIFVQQPRNAPDGLQVPYCQTAPKNTELDGLFHCQFAGSDFTKFSGDQTGNVPLGLSAVSPPGSCPAKPDGPVPDGVQLNTLVQSSGTPNGGSAGATTPALSAAPGGSASSVATAVPVVSGSAALVPSVSMSAVSAVPSAPASGAGATPSASQSAVAPPDISATADAADAKPFTLQNGKDAQQLNAQFATLTADSPCTDGETSCVGTQLGQCVGGKFVVTSCSASTQCFALPLVNEAGTSVACTTESDAEARIAVTGATGGITGA